MKSYFKPIDHTVPLAVNTRCNQKLLLNGYTYNYHASIKSDKGISWRCMRSKKAYDGKYCHAIAMTFTDGEFQVKNFHIHQPQFDQNEMAFIKSQFILYLDNFPDCNVEELITVAVSTLPKKGRVTCEALLKRVYSTYQTSDKNAPIKKSHAAVRKSRDPSKRPTKRSKRTQAIGKKIKQSEMFTTTGEDKTTASQYPTIIQKSFKPPENPLNPFGTKSLMSLLRVFENVQRKNEQFPMGEPGNSKTVELNKSRQLVPVSRPRRTIPVVMPRPGTGPGCNIPIILARPSTSNRIISNKTSNHHSMYSPILPPTSHNTLGRMRVPKPEIITVSSKPSNLRVTDLPKNTSIMKNNSVSSNCSSSATPLTHSAPRAKRQKSNALIVSKVKTLNDLPEPSVLEKTDENDAMPILKPMVSVQNAQNKNQRTTFTARRWVQPEPTFFPPPETPGAAFLEKFMPSTDKVDGAFATHNSQAQPTVASSREHIRAVIGSLVHRF